MKLTATGVKAAKPKKKAYKRFDGRGLFLQVGNTGSESWRPKYGYGGKGKLLTIGPYPEEVSLAEARDKAKLPGSDGASADGVQDVLTTQTCWSGH